MFPGYTKNSSERDEDATHFSPFPIYNGTCVRRWEPLASLFLLPRSAGVDGIPAPMGVADQMQSPEIWSFL